MKTFPFFTAASFYEARWIVVCVWKPFLRVLILFLGWLSRFSARFGSGRFYWVLFPSFFGSCGKLVVYVDVDVLSGTRQVKGCKATLDSRKKCILWRGKCENVMFWIWKCSFIKVYGVFVTKNFSWGFFSKSKKIWWLLF